MKSFLEYLREARVRSAPKRQAEEASGDCMEAAAKMLVYAAFGESPKGVGKNSFLVHALVYGQGPVKGRRFAHAWVETGGTVYDHSNGNRIEMPKAVYYAIGGVRPEQKGAYARYDMASAKRRLLSTGHYGPWDLDESLEENKISDVRKVGRKRVRVDRRTLAMLKGTVSEAIVTGRPTTNVGARARASATAPLSAGDPDYVTWQDLKRLESMLDALFAQAGLDIAFTKHFWERINGSRGYGGTISIPEIQDAFTKTFRLYADKIRNHQANWRAIILDARKQHLNIPFVLNWDSSQNEMSIVATTAMKKQNFMAREPRLPV